MTLLSQFGIHPARRGHSSAPCTLALEDLSVIVPVRDNQTGIHRLLDACLHIFSPTHHPREIVIVDNLSYPPLELPPLCTWGLPVRLLFCDRPGAAAARNLGMRQARGNWLLFLDADCIPMHNLVQGYQQALNGSLAYVGVVRASQSDPISRYYESQGILTPPPVLHQGVECPAFLITANALVWRVALEQIGGFDERFPDAAGEDIDAGVRLWEVGPLAYAPEAQVLHSFEPSLRDFMQRFIRYGRGNRRLSVRYQVDLTPQRFRPRIPSACNQLLACAQLMALRWGYVTTRPVEEGKTPLPMVSMPEHVTSEPMVSKTRPFSGPQTTPEVAVFIDGDQMAPQRLQQIWKIAAAWGPIVICRVYRNLPSPRWERLCQGGNYPHLEVIVEEVNPDLRLAMDVEAFLQTTTIKRFCLVSNDGDFASVARRLKEVGQVVGIGAANAAKIFRRECHLFIPLDQNTSTRSLHFPDDTSLMDLQAK